QGELAPGSAPIPSEAVRGKLSQQYSYLAKGRQCFVFASADGKEVLKFLNYNRFYFPACLFSLPIPETCRAYGARRKERFQITIQSFSLAKERLAEETGIDYLHLQEGGSLPRVELLGPRGSRRYIDLNR